MLVLSRRRNERIIIGEGDERIEILVVEIRHGQIRLGVTAPRTVPVDRAEIHERKNRKEPAA